MNQVEVISTCKIESRNIIKIIKAYIDFNKECHLIKLEMKRLGSAERIYREMVQPFLSKDIHNAIT